MDERDDEAVACAPEVPSGEGVHLARRVMLVAIGVAILAIFASALREPREEVVAPISPVPYGHLVVRVLDGDGNPVPRAEASLTVKPAGSYERSTLGFVREGSVEFAERLDGIVDVWGATDAEGETIPWGPARAAVSPSLLGELEVRLPPGRAISGRVVDAAGNGVPSARLRARSHLPSPRPRESSAVANDDGTFTFRNLGEGEHSLWLVVSADGRFAAPVVAREDASGLVLRLLAGVAARFEVVGEDDRPLAGASVRVTRRIASGDGGWEYPDTSHDATLPDGTVRIDGLDPSAQYMVAVHGPTDGPGYGSHRIEPWQPADTRVRLERAFDVRGRVVDERGQGVAARVWRRTSPTSQTGTDTFSDGRFEVEDLPHAGARLSAAPVGERWPEFRWVRVSPERPEVVLVLRERAPRLTLGRGRPGQRVRFVREGEGADSSPIDREADAASTVSFRDLEEDAPYAVWVQPFDAGSDLSLLTSGFRLPDEDVRLELVPGKAVLVRLKGVEDARDVKVSVAGPLGTALPARHTREWAFEVRGLPDGRWTVTADALGPTGALHADAVVESGSTVDLTLRPK